MNSELSKEFLQYNYYNDTDDWKKALPGFQLTASTQQNAAPLVSIIVANFNNKRYLKRMMDSLVQQTIGIENLQVLFVDDKSTDKSLEVVLPYVEQFPSIEIYQLDRNTGGAHGPRNVGILNARGKYLVFLDADDWYAKDGIENLYAMLEASGDKIGFGGIIRSINNKHHKAVVAYLEDDFQHRSIQELPFEYYAWLGPQGIIVDAELVKEKNLHFIDQRVADDVTFFYQVMRLTGQISQTTKLTTYLNRDDSNESLSKGKTEAFMISWLRALAFIKESYPLDRSLTLFLAKRLEWLVNDFALSFDTGYGFSKSKVRHFHELLLSYLGDMPFDPSAYMREPACQAAWRYLQKRDYSGLVFFVAWNSLEAKDKRWQVVNDLYCALPATYQLPKIWEKCYGIADGLLVDEQKLQIDVTVYSKETVDGFELRSIADPWEFVYLDYQALGENRYRVTLSCDVYSKLTIGEYRLLVRTDKIYDYSLKVCGIAGFLCTGMILQEDKDILLITKQELPRSDYLVVNTDGVEVIEAVATGFDQNGKPALITKDKQVVETERIILQGAISDEEVTELMQQYHLEKGGYRVLIESPIYRRSAEGHFEKIAVTKSVGSVLNVIDFALSQEQRVYIEFLPGQFVLAEKESFQPVAKIEQGMTERVGHFSGKNFIVLSEELPIYTDRELESRSSPEEVLHQGDLITVADFCITRTGKYVMVLTDGGYISGDISYTQRLADQVAVATYQTTIGKYVIIGREEMGYISPQFSRETIARRYLRGTGVTVVGFGIGNNGIPRLKLSDGNYLTAHRKFVQFKGFGSW